MASIKCTNCGATLKTPTAIPAGKKVKCPKCGKPFVVEDEEEKVESDSGAFEPEETPKPKKPVKKPAKDEDDEEGSSNEEDDEPKKSPAKKTGKSNAGDAPKGGSSKLLLIIVGVTLMLCCLGCGTVGWMFQAAIKGFIGFGDAVAADLKKLNENLDKDKTKVKPADKPPEPPPPIPKADFVSTSVAFGLEFTTNQDAAKKYEGKVVELTGDVSGVSFFGGQRKLGITLDAPGWTINVPIHPYSHAKVHRLSKGQRVKVVSVFTGIFGQNLSLDESTLTEITPSQIVEVTSESLSAAFEKDSAPALAQYTQKTLLVTGTVIERGKAKGGAEFAHLKGGKKLIVQVNGNTLGSLEVDKLAKGNTAVLRVEHIRHEESTNLIILSSVVVVQSK